MQRKSSIILAYLPDATSVPASVLSAVEQRLPYARRMRLPADAGGRRQSLCGLGLAAWLVRRTDPASELRWQFAESGRPSIAGAPDFSISHTRALVACALSTAGAVGLDVEHRADVRAGQLRLLPRAREALTTQEAAQLWTQQEAQMKWAGLGMRQWASQGCGVARAVAGGARCASLQLHLPGGYLGTIACQWQERPPITTVISAEAWSNELSR